MTILCWFCLSLAAQAGQQITILHWNDFHAQNLPWKDKIEGIEVTVGGAAYLAGLLDSLKTRLPGAITLHAGDEFTGTPISSITAGQSQIEILNKIMPDAFELGNHEFDYGWANLKERRAAANFPMLCCNVLDSATGQPIAQPDIVLQRHGVKIAVIGVMHRNMAASVLAGALQGLKIVDPAPIVNQLLDSLEVFTDIQVALTHEGVAEDQRLAQRCPRLDVIVGGHRHATLFEPLVENGVPILEAGSRGEYLGIFQAEVDTAANRIVSCNGKLVLVDVKSIRPRDDIAALVGAQEGVVSAELNKVIGRLADPWVRADEAESNVGDWTCDAMIHLTGRDVAFINSGGLRKDVPAGPVTVRDIWELHPFGNKLMGFELTGDELRRAISFQAKEGSHFLQVGGLRYRARRHSGEILDLSVGGKPVDPERKYPVVTNEYVIGHSEKYFGFGLGDREITDLGWIDRELVLKAFSSELTASPQAGTVQSKKDGRIVLE